MNKLARLIQRLGHEELLLILKDLDSGTIERLVTQRLAVTTPEKKICPVCGARIAPGEAMKLEFGPGDLRKQAHFDGPDCLEYFIKQQTTRT